MFQAGVKNITLYENKDITFNFFDPSNIYAITDLQTLGEVISIVNNQRPKFEVKSKLLDSGKRGKQINLDFFLYSYDNENEDTIDMLIDSIYGWCFLVEFYDGTFKFYNTPLFCRESEIKPHDEMVYSLTLKTAVNAVLRRFDYTADTTAVYRADTTLLTADTTIYTADYAL